MTLPKAVIFDIGGVLMFDVWEHLFLDDEGSIASLYGVDRERLEEIGVKLWGEFAYLTATDDAPWNRIEERYWQRFLDLTTEDIASTTTTADLIELSTGFIRAVSPAATARVLEGLMAKGVALTLASNNNEFWFHRQMHVSGLSKYFTPARTVLSCRIGVGKADASGKMFTEALRVSGVQASEALFIDDRKENLDRAAALGIPVHLFPAEQAEGWTALEKEFSA